MTSFPPAFGPMYWDMVHFLSQRYDTLNTFERRELKKPEHETTGLVYTNELNACRQFLVNIAYLLPCPNCTHHALAFIATHPIPLDDDPEENSMFRWSFDFHNHVNVFTHKRQLTYEEFQTMFNSKWKDQTKLRQIYDANNHRIQDHAKIAELELNVFHYQAVVMVVMCIIMLLALYLMVNRSHQLSR
jgi:hypothetical protein